MSYDAWGDDDARELPDGCWHADQVAIVMECIKELMAEPLYEGGDKARGVSTRFLARLTVLQANAGLLEPSNPLVREAEAMFCGEPHEKVSGS